MCINGQAIPWVIISTRIIWGFIGSRHSRFTDFVVGPARVAAYLQGRGSSSAGHNPLGGWSVLLLLSLLLVQAISGLFNSGGVLFSGPLCYWASSGFRDAMGVVHDLVFNGLLALVFLHISAVFYHQLKLKDKLLQAMLHGMAWHGIALGQVGTAVPAPGWWAVIIATTVGLALWWGLAQAPQPSLSW